jgi:hypothetical protein
MAVQLHSVRPYLLFSFPVSRLPLLSERNGALDSTRDAAIFLEDVQARGPGPYPGGDEARLPDPRGRNVTRYLAICIMANSD